MGVLSRLQSGDPGDDAVLAERLNQAFAKHQEPLLRYCARELRGFSSAEVEELAQEVLLTAWRKLPTYQPDQPFRAFLWGIAAMTCANARRRKRDVLTDDGVLDPGSDAATAVAGLLAEERDRLVQAAAHAVLEPADQEIVHLRWVLDYPLEDIARQMNLPSVDAVRVALQRCKRRLDKEIHRQLAEVGHGISFLDAGSGR